MTRRKAGHARTKAGAGTDTLEDGDSDQLAKYTVRPPLSCGLQPLMYHLADWQFWTAVLVSAICSYTAEALAPK